MAAHSASGRLDPVTTRRWIVGICSFSGAWGVLTGFAVFMLLHKSQAHDEWTLAIGLGSAAAAALVVEMLRHAAGGQLPFALPVRSGVAHVVITLLTLAVFELFVLAAHTAADIFHNPHEKKELRDALLGPVLESVQGAPATLSCSRCFGP